MDMGEKARRMEPFIMKHPRSAKIPRPLRLVCPDPVSMRTARLRIRRLLSGACGVLAVASASLVPIPIAAQRPPTRVEYDVEFSTLGALLDANCSATGTDRLVGTLVGYEAGNPDSDNVYVGTLLRTTRISHCGSRRNPTTGEDAVCSMSITGDGIYEVMLSIEAGQREGYLQYISNRAQYASLLESLPRPVGQTGSSVTGTCEPPEMAQMQTDYDQGQTAGSPNGQPIEVPSLPPSSYPFTFAARPPTSNWTLKVLRRRP